MNDTAIRQKKRKGGFTLAEFLVVISIIMILAGVSFVAAIRYQSRLRRLEMDQTAKEIFLAAQNQLGLSEAEGTFERLLKQADDPEEKLGIPLTAEGQDGIYCVLYQPGEEERCGEIRNRLLPFGSIDETVRTDGSYLILYEPGAGAVRAVWYSDRYVFVEDDIESTMLSEAAADPDKREHYKGANEAFADHGQPIGYYNGDSSEIPAIDKDAVLKTPEVELVNGDVLYAYVKDENMGTTIGQSAAYHIRLHLEGLSSGAAGWIELKRGSQIQVMKDRNASENAYRVILDDITEANRHFADLGDLGGILQLEQGSSLIPGEDIRVYAVAYLDGKNGSKVTSAACQENSLFAGKREDKVLIGNIRHLENLDYKISGFKPDASELGISAQTDADGTAQYTAQQQKKTISWPDFCTSIAEINGNNTPAIYYRESGKQTQAGYFAPVEPQFALHYNGNTYSIANIPVKTTGSQPGGVFGSVKWNLTVSRLKVVAADITSASSGAALIGEGKGNDLKITVDNVMIQYPKVLAASRGTMANDAGAVIGNFEGKELIIRNMIAANSYRSGFSTQADRNAPSDLSPEYEKKFWICSSYGIAGGLVGEVKKGTVQITGCAAAVYVDGGDYAGGLIGVARSVSTVSIDSCYVGGHTANGKFLTNPVPGDSTSDAYDETQGRFNIVSRGTYAGGLAGILPDSSSISHTYVSASVYSATYGDVANPAAGEDGTLTIPEAEDVQKEGAFVARYVSPAGAVREGAAADALQFSYCYTSVIINGRKALVYPETLKDFFESETRAANKAYPYDQTLGAVYPMPTVFRLNKQDSSASTAGLPGLCAVHVGDWQEQQKTDTSDKLSFTNGNRLWVDYEMDKPDTTEMQYLTFAVEGKNSGHVVYYILRSNDNFQSVQYYNDVNKTLITSMKEDPNNWEWSWKWKSIDQMIPNRIEITTLENGRIRIRFYLDDKSVKNGGIPFLYYNESESILAGENIIVRASRKNAIPKDKDDLAVGKAETEKDRLNGSFEYLEDNGDGTQTALIANSRNLLNLSFCDKTTLNVTKAVQTDNILWQRKDSEITAKTIPYCEELGGVYGTVKIYDGNNPDRGYAPDSGSFKPIENKNLREYDGGDKTIANLQITPQQAGVNNGNPPSALFIDNGNLNVHNLNLKDPVIEGKGSAAAIIALSSENGANSDVLTLEKIRVYGDTLHIRGISGAYNCVGGVISSAAVKELHMEQVYVYGENALLDRNTNGVNIGGLIGSIKAKTKLSIGQCMFSGYIDASINSGGAGGLIGALEFAGGPDAETAEISECYVAGRTQNYSGGVAGSSGLEQMKDGICIVGENDTGGLIGHGSGPLKISRCFSMAGLYAYASGTQKGIGGLIGHYDNSANLKLEEDYYGGVIRLPETIGYDPGIGILLGNVNIRDQATGKVAELGEMNDCTYITRPENSGLSVFGKCSNTVPADQAFANATDIPPTWVEVTNSYHSNGAYPYKIWTMENGLRTYRGDWIAQ